MKIVKTIKQQLDDEFSLAVLICLGVIDHHDGETKLYHDVVHTASDFDTLKEYATREESDFDLEHLQRYADKLHDLNLLLLRSCNLQWKD